MLKKDEKRDEDIHCRGMMWLGEDKKGITQKETWKLTCVMQPAKNGIRGIWFSYGTPKYLFVSWLAIPNRLSTVNRVLNWNTGTVSEEVIGRLIYNFFIVIIHMASIIIVNGLDMNIALNIVR